MRDPRDPRYITYPLRFLLMEGILMRALKLEARRQVVYQFRTPEILANFNTLLGTQMETVAHPGTLDYLLGKLPPTELPRFLRRVVRELIRGKVLDRWRLEGAFLIAIDGTGIYTFSERHCEHCLTQTHNKGKPNEKTIYYHLVLEAKLVTANGLAFSVMWEFVENPGPNATKQDCEVKAFYRLAEKLKEAFPQLSICLLLDGIYLSSPVVKICRDKGWNYIATFKEGHLPERWREYQKLKELAPENRKEVITKEGARQQYAWVNGLELGEGKDTERMNAFECIETTPNGVSTTFAWGTNLSISAGKVETLANGGGRLRWKIENQGFNEQKNGGYEMEHTWSENWSKGKQYYALLQIAHVLLQLIEKGSLLTKEVGKAVKKAFGGVRKVAEYLKESLRTRRIPPEAVDLALAQQIQIRLDST